MAILLVDVETQELVARAAKGVEEEVERGVRIPIGRGFAGRIAAERLPILVEDVDHADILNPILREKGIRSLLGVPLIVEGTLIGVRLQPTLLKALDKWNKSDLSRPEAIRHLVEAALDPSAFRLSERCIVAIDTWAQTHNLSRAQAICRFVDLGLKA